MKNNDSIKLIAHNRKARHDYHILEVEETGIVLTGTEVKSIRRGQVNLRDAYATVEQGEVWLHGVHISPYEEGNRFNVDPDRKRKLLLHKREIVRLQTQVQQKGLTLVPTKMYFKDSLVKVELGLARGKKNYDKRQDMIRKDVEKAIRSRVQS